LFGCDDTGKAIVEEVNEIDKQEVKRDVQAAASAVGSAAREVARETGKVVDEIDKKAAEKIRGER
jgi:hypothetical protein